MAPFAVATNPKRPKEGTSIELKAEGANWNASDEQSLSILSSLLSS